MFDVSVYNVLKKGACQSSKESFPIGNGDLGANVWVDTEGVLNLLLSKTDSFSEAYQLLKVGLLKIHFDRVLFSSENPPESLLDLNDGTVTVRDHAGTVTVKVAAFRGRPLFGIRLTADRPTAMYAEPVIWRTKEKTVKNDCTTGYVDAPFEVRQSADVSADPCTWYHHNEWSYVDYTRKNQHLPELKDLIKDRTVAASFAVTAGECQSTLYLSVGCEIVRDPLTLTDTLRLCAKKAAQEDRFDEYLEENRLWWTDYFHKYYIYITGTEAAETVSRLYTHQKYITGCANRGKMPIKFNGSIFTVAGDPDDKEDYDWRRWGGDFWIQNTRLIYWNMLFSGDFDGMKPFFEFCHERIPVFREIAVSQFGIDGLLMPETVTVNGSYREYDFGYGQENTEAAKPVSEYIGQHYNGMLEISMMMICYLQYTGDRAYFERICLPFIHGILTFFRERFPVRDGKMFLHTVSSLETWWHCHNDTPDIAGLAAVTEGLEKLGYPTVIDRAVIPEIPREKRNGKEVIAPCVKTDDTSEGNVEVPEMYVLFPFFRYHLAKGIPVLLENTYEERLQKFNNGWSQNLIWAAMLGKKDKCRDELPDNFNTQDSGYFFDAYFGPNFDETPDQDHGSTNSIALRMMLIQDHGGKIIRYPAWPEEWHVEFRLPVNGGIAESKTDIDESKENKK